jgi:predicted ester cyclase
MHARVSAMTFPRDRMKEVRRYLNDDVVPAASALTGRTQAFWLADEAAGKIVVVSMYDTEENLIRNREAAREIRLGSAERFGGRVTAVSEFEVVAEIVANTEGAEMEDHKRLARRIYEEVLNGRRLDLLDELVRPDYVEHDPLPGQREGLDGIRDRYTMLIDALDPHFTIEDMIAEGDRVVVRWTNAGTHVGPFLGSPPTNRSFRIPGIDIYRVDGGKLAEHWHVVDVYGQLVQIGLIPPPPT